MNVLLFSNLFPSSWEPTRGLYNRHAFKALTAHCGVRLIAPLPWWTRTRHPASLWRVPCENTTGIEAAFPTYWSLPGLPRLHARAMQVSLRGYVTRLRREFPFDVILASWAYPDGVAAAHLAAQLGCPLVTMILGSDLNALAGDPALRPQIQWGLGRAQHVITVSAALRERVIELGIPAEKVIVQHNGVDGTQFTIRDRTTIRARLGLSATSPLLCYVGNFKSEKGVDVLVEAMGHLRRCGREDVELALIGSGPLESKLRTRVQELHLESQVRFCGRRGHDEIPDWISAADALCLPSHREGCPNVILEALASGRPVVASRVGGVPELLDERSGVMVPPGDPEALADGLASILARQWEPEVLRACVEFPSWEQYGLVLRDALTSAIHAYRVGERNPGAVLI